MNRNINSKVILILFWLSLCQCCNKGIWNDSGGFRPRRPNFELAKKQYTLLDNYQIDTNAVYIEVWPYSFTGDTSYIFYRFFHNGKVYVSKRYTKMPNNNGQFNDLQSGLIGYYTIENGNELIIEIFEPNNTGNQYEWYYGKVMGDSIIFDQEDSHLFFIRTKKKLKEYHIIKLSKYNPSWLKLNSQPDW